MADSEYLKYCRYYQGEEDSPFWCVDQNLNMLWMYERAYASGAEDGMLPEYISDYEALGLRSFCANDGVPVGLKALLFNRYAKTNYSIRDTVEPFKAFYLKYYNELKGIYFDRYCKEVWAIARLHHSLLRHIQNHSFWEQEEIPDIPLTEEQMVSLVKGYDPDWDCRYATFFLGGWFYITRSGYWLKKFKYQKGDDGYYHIIEHYTTEHDKGRNLLMQIIMEGNFEPKIFDDRLQTLFLSSSFQIKMTSDTESVRTKGLEPLLCEDPRIIILGTLPGAESLIHKQYYYSNSNRIWKVLCLLTGESIPNDYAQKKALLAKYHIVLWDYYESAIRYDSSDEKNIRDGKPNDIVSFLLQYPTIRTVAINGFGKYRKFGVRLEKKLAGIPNLTEVRILCLPETSGSNKNHGWGDLEKLSAEWKTIFE